MKIGPWRQGVAYLAGVLYFSPGGEPQKGELN